MSILAIDPGSTESAWLVLGEKGDGIYAFAKAPNDEVLRLLRDVSDEVTAVVIEKVESYGMAVGADVFETVFWSGRFAEAVAPLPIERVSRRTVKLHVCADSRARDSNIRQALIDRFGGPAAIGRKAAPGPLYGIAGDVWSALAVAVTYADLSEGTRS